MTPIQALSTYLQGAGLLGAWTGPDDVEQPPVKLQTRKLEEDDSAISNDDRILLIKQISSGSGTRYTSAPNFVFAVLGKVSKDDEIYVETYANLVFNALLDFDSVCGSNIIGIDPLGAVNGAYQMESGRDVYDMEWVVNLDTGWILP